MKHLSTTLIVLSLALSACKSTTGVDRAQSAADAIKAIYQGLQDAPAKMDAVTASLTELGKGDGDMQAQYATFSKDVTALTEHRDRMRRLRSQLESNQDAFVSAWEQRLASIQSEDLRKRAEARRDAVVEKFESIATTSAAGREEFEPWMQKVTDVKAYLENDLNPTGVASVADVIGQINDGSESIKGHIADVIAQLDDLGKSIAANKPPPPEPAEGAADAGNGG